MTDALRGIKVVVLAGGLGTRLAEETEARPKPMVEIGGRPILWHILKHYAHYGCREFVIAAGYRSDVIKRYFDDYSRFGGDLTIRLRSAELKRHAAEVDDWTVHLVETGKDTQTGGRLRRLKDWVGADTFMLTYGDGVSDVDLQALMAFHRAQKRVATVTAVRPPARFGGLTLNGDAVAAFKEKPQIGEGWINGGFMVFEPAIFDRLAGDPSSLERDALERLAAEGQLSAFRHEKFWQSMDTLRDKRRLDGLWDSGQPPWKVWP